jgi:ATP-dependent DNA ligase
MRESCPRDLIDRSASGLSSVPEMQFQPMPLTRSPKPFTHPDWLFEIKWDGFRALLCSDEDGVRLVSRNGNIFKSFPGLCDGLARDLKRCRCVLDGEIVCLDCKGKPQFRDLLFRCSDVPSRSFMRSICSGTNTHGPMMR